MNPGNAQIPVTTLVENASDAVRELVYATGSHGRSGRELHEITAVLDLLCTLAWELPALTRQMHHRVGDLVPFANGSYGTGAGAEAVAKLAAAREMAEETAGPESPLFAALLRAASAAKSLSTARSAAD